MQKNYKSLPLIVLLMFKSVVTYCSSTDSLKILDEQIFIKVLADKKMIDGKVIMSVENINQDSLHFFLYAGLKINQVFIGNDSALFHRKGNEMWVICGNKISVNMDITITYHGSPYVSKQGIVDGGFNWITDASNHLQLSVLPMVNANSSWFPITENIFYPTNKIKISIEVPLGSTVACGGNLIDDIHSDENTSITSWQFDSPISFNQISFFTGSYNRLDDWYRNGADSLKLSVYYFSDNLNKAFALLQQEKLFLGYLEILFGKTINHTSLKIAESAVLSSSSFHLIGYGNNFENNSYGFDETLLFALAQQWFTNNNLFSNDSMRWLPNAFSQYACVSYVGWLQGDSVELKFINQIKPRIKNQFALTAVPDSISLFQNSDWQYKGACVLFSLQKIIDNDSVWFHAFKDCVRKISGRKFLLADLIPSDLETKNESTNPHKLLNQYLYSAAPPLLQYSLKKKGKKLLVSYRWVCSDSGFVANIQLLKSKEYHFGIVQKKYETVVATTAWNSVLLTNMKQNDFEIDQDEFYFNVKRLFIR